MENEILLDIENLWVKYSTDDGIVNALNGVSLKLKKSETFGLVGETGAGKTTLAKAIMSLIPSPPGKITDGKILFREEDLLKCTPERIRDIRGKDISMIFQDPMTSLNPVMKIGDQIKEVIETHNPKMSDSELNKKVVEMLNLVGISADRTNEYPHQFSGGMKQRVIIAIALACNPLLLIADEPTTALDVTIQAQVLEMVRDLKKKLNTSMILITHDLGVVVQNCDKVAIVYAGEILEVGTLRELFKNPLHPYTKGLFDSIPSLVKESKRLKPIEGLMPDPTDLPKGCSFCPRCKFALEKCKTETPDPIQREGEHQVKCFLYEQGNR
ncbi:MAG: ABC transporter ATP-binding protein [Pleomorphochaeta sp.]